MDLKQTGCKRMDWI